MKLILMVLASLSLAGCGLVFVDLDADMPYERARVTVVNRSPFPISIEQDGRPILWPDGRLLLLQPTVGGFQFSNVKLTFENLENYAKPVMVTITWHRGKYPDRSIALHAQLKTHGATDRFVFDVLDAGDCNFGGYNWVQIRDVGECSYWGGTQTFWYADQPKEHCWVKK